MRIGCANTQRLIVPDRDVTPPSGQSGTSRLRGLVLFPMAIATVLSGIRSRLILPVVVACVALWALVIVTLYLLWGTAVIRAQDQVDLEVARAQQALHRWLDDTEALLARLAVSPGVDDPSCGGSSVADFVRLAQGTALVAYVGRDLGSACFFMRDSKTMMPLSATTRDLVRSAADKSGLVVLGLQKSSGGTKYTVTFAYPLRGEAGELRGVLLYAPVLLDVQNVVVGRPRSNMMRIAVIDADLRTVMRNVDEGASIGQKHSGGRGTSGHYLGREFKFVRAPTGQSFIYQEMVDDRTGWRMTASLPVAEIVAASRSAFFLVLAVALLATAFILGLGYRLSLTIVRPIELMADLVRGSRYELKDSTAWTRAPLEITRAVEKIRELNQSALSAAGRYRRLIMVNPIAMLVCEGPGSPAILNNAMLEMFGKGEFPVGSVQGWLAARGASPADSQVIEEAWAKLKKAKESSEGADIQTVNASIRDAGGLVRRVIIELATIDTGSHDSSVVAIIDISAQYQAEQRRASALLQFKTLIETMVDPVISVDRQSVIRFANSAAEQAFGYDSGELLGKALGVVLPASSARAHERWTTEFFQARGGARRMAGLRTVQGCRKDGSPLQLQISISRSFGAEDELATAVIRDVTPLNVAETKLQAATERLDLALLSARGGAWQYDQMTKQIKLTDHWYKVTQHAPGSWDVHLPKFLELVHADDRNRYQAFLEDFAGEDVSRVIEYRLRFGDGRDHWVMDAGRRTTNDAERMLITGIQIDIDESRNLRERVQQSEKLSSLGQLAGGVAHDVNNDLAVVLGSTELILEHPGIDRRVASLAERILRSVRRSTALVQRMLAFSRKSAPEATAVDVGRELVDVIVTLHRVLPGGIDIEFEPPKQPLHVLLDRVLLESSLLNLSLNARDAMPDGGVLRFALALEPSGGKVAGHHAAVLRVSDTGQGMSEDVQRRVFDPFFTTKAPGGGTGLGLSMVYGFVQQAGGTIEIDSTPGKGTTFILRFPLIDRGIETPQVKQAEQTREDGTVVLVVEDNEMVRATLREQLESLGCTVLEAADGESARMLIQARHSDIKFVLSDLNLGTSFSGMDLAEWVESAGFKIPGAIASGYVDIDTGRTIGCGWTIARKPLRREHLAALIKAA